MVRGSVVPDEQLGHLRAHLAQRLHEGEAVVLATALPDQGDQVTGGRIQRPMDHAAGVASGEYDDLLLAASRPGRPQWREPAPRRLLPQPHFPPPPHRGCPFLRDGLFFPFRPGPGPRGPNWEPSRPPPPQW